MAAKCKACGAPIIWMETPSGKYLPCDEGLVPYRADRFGKQSVVAADGCVVRCTLDFEGKPSGLGRIPHWATCPQADKFRRKRGGST